MTCPTPRRFAPQHEDRAMSLSNTRQAVHLYFLTDMAPDRLPT